MGKTYYVNAKVKKSGDGSADSPFKRIQEAADIAMPGDEVLVLPGIYRESVDPKHAGTPENPIVYKSVKKHGAVITGAERIKLWKHLKKDVWYTQIPNKLFTDRNPYTTLVSGDWFNASFLAHTGDVYLNGKSMYEVTDMDDVLDPVPSKISWDPVFSVFTWYTKQSSSGSRTIIYANFGGADPNEENVEVSVRKSCFYPEEEGIGYITLSGFTVRQAATQWAPPTAYQEGMIGPHWSKGWIIEDCDISESKCSGISLGKYLQPDNDNKWSKWKYKDGTQTERDCILQAQREGWSKETVGSHIIRNCEIHDCGQTGIVGHMGGVFSIIEGNHIHHINNKQNLAGAEIGGIKMHAAIDVIIRSNHIHHCTRGLWLDWQAQGTRVTGNLFHSNTLPYPHLLNMQALLACYGEDIFIEVSHGPTLLDNNIMLSQRAVKLATQGVAMVHNLVCGALVAVGRGTDNGSKSLNSPRYTPYHVPHGTDVAGFMTFPHGDDRFYNNIFLQQKVHPLLHAANKFMKHGPAGEWDDANVIVGLNVFDDYPTEKEWLKEFEGYCGMGSAPSDRYYMHFPVWASGNLYLGGAKPWKKEKRKQVVSNDVYIKIEEKEGKWILSTNLDKYIPAGLCRMIDTEKLGMAFEPEQKFENPDGSPITFNRDYFDAETENVPLPGPFAGGHYDGELVW